MCAVPYGPMRRDFLLGAFWHRLDPLLRAAVANLLDAIAILSEDRMNRMTPV